jgi:hypothetical protein
VRKREILQQVCYKVGRRMRVGEEINTMYSKCLTKWEGWVRGEEERNTAASLC